MSPLSRERGIPIQNTTTQTQPVLKNAWPEKAASAPVERIAEPFSYRRAWSTEATGFGALGF